MPSVLAASSAQSTTASLVVDAPSGLRDGQLLFAVMSMNSSGSFADMTAPSSTWELVGAGLNTSGRPRVKVWRKSADFEPAAYTFSKSDGPSGVITLLALDGFDPAAPIHITPSYSTFSPATTSHVAPSISPTLPNTLLVCVFTSNSPSGSHSTPSGMTEWADISAASTNHSVCTEARAGTGSTGTRTATASSSAVASTLSMAVANQTTTSVTASDTASGSDLVGLEPVVALGDTGTGSDSVSPGTDLAVTDIATGSDTVDAGQWAKQAASDAAAGSESVALDRTTFADLAEQGSGDEQTAILRATGLADTATATDSAAAVVRSTTLADAASGVDDVRVVDIPFTRVLPLRSGPVYDLVVVARVPQVAGPPAFIEVDPIEWKQIRYGNTLSQPQDLEASCLISSVTDPVVQRLRRLSDAATELWLYRNGKIVFAGPLVGWRTSGESLTLSARGLLAYLSLMVITKDLRFDQVDQFSFVTTMIDQWQVLDYGNFGIDTSTVGASGVKRDGTYLRDELHNVAQRVAELGQRINGFDAEVDPATRKLQLWYPLKGVDRSSGEDAIVVDARNITSGDTLCSVAAGDLASEAFGTGTSSGASGTLFSARENPELRARYGRCAVTGTWSDVSEQTTLDAHTQALLDARSEALIVPGPDVRVTPDADLANYSIGDTIAYDLQAQLGITGAFRIRHQRVSVSSTGQESVTLEFV